MFKAKTTRQLFAVHRWTGLLTGIVILFLSLTGTGLVFITEIDRALHSSFMTSNGSGPMIEPDSAVKASSPSRGATVMHGNGSSR